MSNETVFHILTILVQIASLLWFVWMAGRYVGKNDERMDTIVGSLKETKATSKEHTEQLIQIQNSLAYESGVAKGKAYGAHAGQT